MKIHSGHLLFFVCLSLCVWLSSCQKGDQNIGQDLIKGSNLEVYRTDTFTLNTATVLLDTFPTSNTSLLLTGKYQDSYTGTTQAKAFMQLIPVSTFSLDQKAIFDSLVVLLPYTYSYGDTIPYQQLNIYPLQQRIDAQTNYYNNSGLPRQAQAWGSKTFQPRPRSKDTLRIRVNQVAANSVFNWWFTNPNGAIEDWLAFFKGFSIEPAGQGALLGFASANLLMRLYYHTPGFENTNNASRDFRIGLHFHQILADRSSTPWASLQTQRQSLTANLSSERLLMQGGTALGVRVDMPSLQLFRNITPTQVNAAVLYVKPLENLQQASFSLPPELALFYVSDNNRVLAAFPNSYSQQPQYVPLSLEPNTGEKVYAIDLTEYVIRILNSKATTWDGLLIVPRTYAVETRQMVIGSPRNPNARMQLVVYYTRFQP
jgi:hypothetical protein